jgi:DNA repair exonuclease SbcCD nuclease subunit
MRIIYAADIHLDSPLHGLCVYQDTPVETLRTATRDAFSALINLAIEESIDFMVIAGDLYDGTWRDHHTGIFFCKDMGRPERAGIPLSVIKLNEAANEHMASLERSP